MEETGGQVMKKYLNPVKWKLFLRYMLILLIFVMLGLFIVYMFDDVLNGLIIDVLQLINGNPFETFSKLFKIFLPFIVACFCFILVYFLCKDLTLSMRTLMDGMDDIMRKQRNKVVFPKEMRKAQGALMKVVDEYQAYLKSAKNDEEKKKDLIYLLAQDIRMPLAKIMMYLDFLESEQRISSEVKMDYIVHVLDESLLLEDMMNEFFDITRFNLQYAKWTPEEMFMDRMMEQVIDECYYMAEDKAMQIRLVQDSHLSLYADSAKVVRVMRDLINTMIYVGNKGEVIDISLRQRNHDYFVHMQVDGPHFQSDVIAHMFHNFYRLEEVNDASKGHAMGLGIAKQIIDMMKGSIRAESIGKRFSFYVKIPVHEKPEDDIIKSGDKNESRSERKVSCRN